MNLDIDKLKALALAATPSKWSVSGSYIAPTREDNGTTYVENWRSIALVNCDADRAFIAAANPVAVLELIAEIARLRREEKNDKIAYDAVLQRQHEIRSERDQLKVENEALRKDCERLDWLDDQYINIVEGQTILEPHGELVAYEWSVRGTFGAVRDAIDDAMGPEQQT